MLKVTFCATLSALYYIYTPLEKRTKVLLRAALIFVPLLLYKGLKLYKELFDRVEIRRVER
jgi:hypothetical protein